MRIGEEVCAVQPRRRWCDTPNNEENRPDAWSSRRPNEVIRVLAKGAIGVSRTVRVEMHKVDGGAQNEQKCEQEHEQNTSQGIRRP